MEIWDARRGHGWIRRPWKTFNDPSTPFEERVGLISAVWRILACLKLAWLFPWSHHLIETGIAAGIFLTAPMWVKLQFHLQASIWNAFIRLMGGKADKTNLHRALTLNLIIPNLAVGAYVLGPYLAYSLGALVASLVLWGALVLAAGIVESRILARAFQLSRVQHLVFLGIHLFLISYAFILIPVYLSERFSPGIVSGDADLSLLEWRALPVDSSKDGSQWLANALKEPFGVDTADVLSASMSDQSPDSVLQLVVDSIYANLKPLRSATWFDKRVLLPARDRNPLSPDSTQAPKEIWDRLRYSLSIMDLHFAGCLDQGRYGRADTALRETLTLLRAISHADMGMVGAMLQVTFTRRASERLEKHLHQIPDPVDLRRFGTTLESHPITLEPLLNSYRRFGYELDQTMQRQGELFHSKWSGVFQSYGILFPDFMYRKWFDPRESIEINRALWAKTIAEAAQTPKLPGSPTLEEQRLERNRNAMVAVLFRNSLGRILSGISRPLYVAFAKQVRETQRHAAITRVALLMRAAAVESPHAFSLEPHAKVPFGAGLSISGNSLISKDTVHSDSVFAIRVR